MFPQAPELAYFLVPFSQPTRTANVLTNFWLREILQLCQKLKSTLYRMVNWVFKNSHHITKNMSKNLITYMNSPNTLFKSNASKGLGELQTKDKLPGRDSHSLRGCTLKQWVQETTLSLRGRTGRNAKAKATGKGCTHCSLSSWKDPAFHGQRGQQGSSKSAPPCSSLPKELTVHTSDSGSFCVLYGEGPHLAFQRTEVALGTCLL